MGTRSTIFFIIISILLLTSASEAQRKPVPADQPLPAPKNSTAQWTPLPTGVLTSVLLQENFSTASDSTPPAGWTSNLITGVSTDKWRFDNPATRIVTFTEQTQPAALFDSDFLSCNGVPENVALESPPFNAPLNSNIQLRFEQYFRSNPAATQAIVEAFDGVQWVIVDSTAIQANDRDTTCIDLTPHVAGVSNARIRFRFKGNCSWYWFVDNIVVTETPIAPSNRILIENFKTGSGATPPAGWVRNRLVGRSYDEWRYDNPGGRNVLPPLGAPFAIFNSDTLSRLGGPEDVALESPTFNTAANSTVTLTMDHFFKGDSGGRATIEVFNGTAWLSVWDSVHSTPNPESLELDISAQVAGLTNAQVRFRWRGWWSWWWMIDNIIITETPGGSTEIISDQFNTSALDTTLWTFLNPRGDGTYSMTGTQLSISVPAGTSHDIWEGGNFAPRVMQSVNNPTNFELRVKFDGLMNQGYQTEGIQVWQDSSNFLRLEFLYDGGNFRRLAWSFVNGIHQDVGTAGLSIVPTAPIYMTVKREGDLWTQSWSTNGVDYTVGTSFTRTMNIKKVGVYAGNVGFPESAAPAFTGLFDYFLAIGSLPVQLARLSAVVTANNNVRIAWTTLTETNNYGFEVQKSQNNSTGFQTVANSFVPGHGTTLTPHDYVWTDMQANAGTWYYRLKQIDLDGSVHYSEPVQVNMLTSVVNSAPKVFSLSQNYPNPFNPSTDIKFSVTSTGHATLEVHNVLGQVVATLFDGQAQAGTLYTVNFSAVSGNGPALTSGVYFYRLQSGETSAVRKLMLIK